MDPKDDILLQNEVLPCKNIIFVYKGKSQNIPRKGGRRYGQKVEAVTKADRDVRSRDRIDPE